ncbi:MFS transporter [Streptomyces nigra]|uniref:MFS transporter n=1 Tax=Streptomyces nigra TaxID=1827580 RepID=UPI000D5286CF|nr:MFS transporter [Streptomyces nigra]AWE50570.1 MFS transporter [Streptomyces nigra]
MTGSHAGKRGPRGLLAAGTRSLGVRNFRLFAGGQIASVTGTWMMVVAQDWLVLDLTGDSGTALATVTALQFTPMLLLTLYGGRIADRYDKRALLTGANIASGLLALLLGLLVTGGAARLWHVYAFALALGVANAVEVPARLSFIAELVGPELVPNASALSGAYFNIARVVGPSLAGLLIEAAGTGTVMLLNAASYAATVAGLRAMRPGELHRPPRPAVHDTRVVEGLAHLRSRPDLVATLSLLAAVSLFGLNLQLTLPLMARTVFHTDAAAFGLLTAALAAGSLLAAFTSTLRRGRPPARLVIGWACAFGALAAATGWAPNLTVALLLLVPTGFASLYFAQAANHRVQLGSDAAHRGRVMALYTLILQGSAPLGALFVGAVTHYLGTRSALWAGGLISVAAALVAAVADRRAPRADTTGTERTPHPTTGTGSRP